MRKRPVAECPVPSNRYDATFIAKSGKCHAIFLHIVSPRHSVVNGPLVYIVKVPARVQCAKVRPEVVLLVAVFRIFAECEDSNV